MQQFSDERVLLESDPKGITLTTHRVRQVAQGSGNANVTSIMLEELASCAIVRRSLLVLLVIAALIALATVFLAADSYDGATILVIGGVIAILFVVFYFASRRQVIELASAGAAIRQDTSGMNLDVALTFIDTVEEAKNKRYLLNR